MKPKATVNCGEVRSVTLRQISGEYHGAKRGFSYHKVIARAMPRDDERRHNTRDTARIRDFIIRRLLERALKDIISENVRFDLRIRAKVYLSLMMADRDRDSYLYIYKVEQMGHDFIPYCVNARKLWKRVHRYFLWTPGQKWARMIKKEIAAGRVYEMAPKVEYKNTRQYGLQLRVYRSQGRDVPDSEKASG